jgi:O-methyltransferase
MSLLSQHSLDSLLYYASRSPAGAIVEIGVYRGGSAAKLATFLRPLFLYDTFEGMPFAGPLDGNKVGAFSDTSVELVRKAVPTATIVKGLFPQSLIDMPPVSFVHADGDQYQTTKDILTHMPSRMVRGGFILFDDFLDPGCEGCTQAVKESPYRVLVIAETGKALVIV